VTAPFAQTVTWVSRVKSGVDDYGNDTFTPTSTTITAIFAPGGSAELTQGGDTVTDKPMLYDVDPSLPVGSNDAFVVDGASYEVDGDPAKYPPNPFDGWQVGQVVPLRRVTG
jgi:hypothetical protein